MRTTITLADDIYQSVKTIATGSGKSFGEVISECVRRYLNPTPIQQGKGKFPSFAIPPSAEVIPGNRAQQLQDEEFMK